MKCEDVQFIYQTDPREADAEVRAHLADCPECQAVAESETAFQSALEQAVQLSVPNTLAARLQAIPNQTETDSDEVDALATDNVVVLKPKSKKSSWTTWGGVAIAASLLMAIGLFNVNQLHSPDGASLSTGQLVYRDIKHHGGLALVKHNMSPEYIDQQMRDFGLQFDIPGQISYVQRCPIGDTYGLHLVYQSESGPVTFIYMPDIEVSGPQGFNYDGMQGMIRPAPKGSMAIVGDGTLNLQATEVELNKGIEWL